MRKCILSALIVGLCGSCAWRSAMRELPIAQGESSTRTKIVMLGTGTPNADPERSGPSVAIVVNDTPYLIDCGPGVVRRASAAHRAGVEALRVSNLKHVFITHLHTDHTLGLADLIFTPWVLDRDEPLEVYGPPGTRAMTDHLLKAYEQDIRIRIDGLEPANTVGYQVNVHEIEPGEIYTDENVIVSAFKVKHGSWQHAYGFRFRTPDRAIVISGDTTPTSILVENAEGCDVLIHEVYSQAGFERRAPEWQRYHAVFHTSTLELAQLARRIQPELLILYHQLFWGATDKELLKEIGRTYDGRVVSAKDLDIY